MIRSHFATRRRRRLNIGLWFAQWALAYVYGTSGLALTTQPMVVLFAMGARYVMDYPHLFTRLIGIAQMLGAIGLIVPALTRIMPGLTPAAALGLTIMQTCAIVVLAARSELAWWGTTNLLLLCLSLLVFWGRWLQVPIHSPMVERKTEMPVRTRARPSARSIIVDRERSRLRSSGQQPL